MIDFIVCIDPPSRLRNFKDDFELNRHPERKTSNTDHQSNRHLLAAKNVSEEIGRPVRNSWLVKEISRSGYKHAESDDAHDSVERAQMFFCRGERAQGRSVCGIAASIGIELFAKPANVFCLMVHYGEHSAEEEKAACLHRLDITAERRGRSREANAKFLQSTLCAG